MLAAGGAPMVSLFGPTNPKKFAPYTPYITIIKAQDFGSGDITAIPVMTVNQAMEESLGNSRSTR
jgi:ADP-heptose:LPS heptosyltransferase